MNEDEDEIHESQSWHWKENRGKKLWSEDDCTTRDPDHETLQRAWLRLVGKPMSSYLPPISKTDAGDGEWLMMLNGMVVWSSYPGGSEIFQGSCDMNGYPLKDE
jgi:hypothetical protein